MQADDPDHLSTVRLSTVHLSTVHLSTAQLEAGLDDIRRAPKDEGPVTLIVRRPAKSERLVVETADFDVVEGLVGDSWRARGNPKMPGGVADPEAQVTLMGWRAIAVICPDVERRPLAGDQLFVDLDLSNANLPPGSRLQVGTAVLEVTAKPHRGCRKFHDRFGNDALRFVNSTEGRELNLRGVNARVVQSGSVRLGDVVVKQG